MLAWINRYLFGAVVPPLLIAAGIFFGFRLRWFHLRHPRMLLSAWSEPSSESGVSPAKALSLSLAGTLGVGNIVGVSAAIAMGGFGAVFWMWIGALCAMLLKYAEIVLAMRHRRYDACGMPHGAAMYYIRDCFSDRKQNRIGKFLAVLFAVFCLLNAVTMGSAIQANAIADALSEIGTIAPVVTGTVLAAVCFLIIRGGSGGMLKLTERLVPTMTVGYVVLSLAAIVLRANRIPYVLSKIVREAFASSAAVGGVFGFLLSDGVRYGMMRGIISNEAGCGTAPAAHAVSDCREPARQGVWGILEVFTDTIVLCTMTALVILLYEEVLAEESDFMRITLHAYGAALGRFAEIFLAVSVVCFGFATIICWAHYGMESVRYCSERLRIRRMFIGVYSGSVLFGAMAPTNGVWEIADFAIGMMSVINLTVLCLMSKEVKQETDHWLRNRKKH